jgi:hypothetical protein
MANLTLRVATNAGDTTKNSPLTNLEIDNNFIALDTELGTKAPTASPTFTGSVTIPGGTINATSVGATTRSTGAFTTLAANGATTLTAGTASTSTTTGTLVVTGGIGASGRVTANDFVGDGSGLTNLDAGDISAGTLAVARGGTNNTVAPTNGGVAFGDGTKITYTAAGTSGQLLQSNGAAAPTWVSPPVTTTISADDGATTRYPVFASGTGAFSTGYIDNTTTPLSYVPSTGTLTASAFAGSGAALTSLNASNLSSGTVAGTLGVIAGSTTDSFVRYTGTTATAGYFNGGTSAPAGTTRLNYEGHLYATKIFGDGSSLTGLPSGVTLSDNNTASTFYPVFASGSGALSTGYIDASTGILSYVPSTGTLTALAFSGSGASLTSLTAGNLSGTIPSAVLGASSLNIGTTSVALNRASANLALTGITSVTGGTSGAALSVTTDTTGVLTLDTGTTGSINVGTSASAKTIAIGNATVASVINLNNNVGVAAGKTVAMTGATSGTVTIAPAATITNYTLTLPPNAGTSNQVLVTDGSGGTSWTSFSGGATVSDDTTTNASTYYLTMSNNQTSGTLSSAVVSSTKLYYNPSTGTLNATGFNSLSDAIKKTGISTISYSVDTVNKLRGVEFYWIESGKKSAGVIAQELENILPHLVDTNDDGVKSVNYLGIIGYLIESVKELDARVKALENK